MLRPSFWTIATIATWALLILLLFIPVGSVLTTSLYDRAGNLTLANYAQFLSEPRFRTAFINTLVVGFGGLDGPLVHGSIMG